MDTYEDAMFKLDCEWRDHINECEICQRLLFGKNEPEPNDSWILEVPNLTIFVDTNPTLPCPKGKEIWERMEKLN